MLPYFALIRRNALPLATGVVLLGISASGAAPGLLDALPYLLPPLMLLGALVARRYPGERALLGWIAGNRHQRRRLDGARGVRVARPRATIPRGGCLIASSLAVRPPPVAGAATC
jgi:hypothetical protein